MTHLPDSIRHEADCTVDGCGDSRHDEAERLMTAHPSPANAPAPQSLRDALRERWDSIRPDDEPTMLDSDVAVFYLPIGAVRAALDAPALTVERLAEAIHAEMRGRFVPVHIDPTHFKNPHYVDAAQKDRDALIGHAATILRALGEGAGEGVDRG